jgi:aspartate aminotransferase-like enzyme
MNKYRLLAPGPTTVPQRVLRAMTIPIIHHRQNEFKDIYDEVIDGLKYIYKTNNKIFIITSSGTGAMEAAVSNFFSPGDKVIVVKGGAFGDRWAEICEQYNIRVIPIDVEWGRSVNPRLIEQRLSEDKNNEVKGVLVTHTETSTGVENDIEEIGQIVKNSTALLMVDSVSGLGTTRLNTDDWNCDVVVSASQKGLMCPPGLAFISVSKKALKRLDKVESPRFYFDLRNYKKFDDNSQTPFTTSISLFYALREALQMFKDEGLENVFARHEKLALATRSALIAININLFSMNHANNVTVVISPDGIDVHKLRKKIRDKFGIFLAGAHSSLKDKCFRIGHMGYVDTVDILSIINALEITFDEMGYVFNKGEGVNTASQYIKEF